MMALLTASSASTVSSSASLAVSSLISNFTQKSLSYNTSSKCNDISRMLTIAEQCRFVQTVDDCLDDDALFSYIQFVYCLIGSKVFGSLLLLVWLLFLFVAIGITADDFLCPLLITIAKSLKMSDNIAGVTFLAFGNGAPDIFSSIIGIGQHDSSLIIGELYGAGIFVTTVVVGSILIQNKFQIMKRPLLRDICFYIATTTLVWSIFFSGQIRLYNSLLYIGIYLFYVVVVVVSGFVYKRNQNQSKDSQKEIFAKMHMPGEKPNTSQKKYKLNEIDQQKDLKSKISLKNYLNNRDKKTDNYEGVVLRRIKYRQYCHNPLHQRRFTVYNISDNISCPRSNNDDQQQSDSIFAISFDSNNNNMEDVNNNITSDNSNDNNNRRPTLSDTGFRFITHSVVQNQSSSIKNEINQMTITTADKHHSEIKSSCKKEFSFREILENFRHFICDNLFSNKISSDSLTITKPNPDCNNNDNNNNDDSIQNLKRRKSIHIKNKAKCFLNFCLESSNIEMKEFRDNSLLSKLLTIIKAPVYFALTLTIPVVDLDLPLNGWHKLLILVQIIISPQICLILTGLSAAKLKFHLIALFISIVLVPIVACTSNKNKQPVYHTIVAYIGFVIAVIVIYTIANEVVDLLATFGIMFNISNFILGITVLAWGNSIGDFISNMSMAKNGFPRMAISACFGGPVLNMLLGIGIPYTILLAKNDLGSIELHYSKMMSVLYTTITASLLTTIVILVCITHFKSSRIHGFVLYALYSCFLCAALCAEMKLF